MAWTTIKRDAHSLYVRTGGKVFRPVPTPNSLTHPDSVGMGSGPYFKYPATIYQEGDKVNARHVAGTTAGRVDGGGDTRIELWHSHGSYLDQPVAKCWFPVTEKPA